MKYNFFLTSNKLKKIKVNYSYGIKYFSSSIDFKNNFKDVTNLIKNSTNYSSLFYFFIPVPELEFCNSKHNGYSSKKFKILRKIRFKPGYQVLLRFFRKEWSYLNFLSSYRQKRLTKEVYLFSCNGATYHHKYYLINTKINVLRDPSKQLLNWKYIV